MRSVTGDWPFRRPAAARRARKLTVEGHRLEALPPAERPRAGELGLMPQDGRAVARPLNGVWKLEMISAGGCSPSCEASIMFMFAALSQG